MISIQEATLKLYHGTSIKHLESILKQGIKPRGKKQGVWDKCPSRHDRVYLSNCYAPYFAFSADEDTGVIFEIDTDKLDARKMGADEDVVAQVLHTHDKTQDLFELTKSIKLEKFDAVWDKSLEAMGTCSYKGAIPVKAITRYAIVDFSKATWLWVRCADISISLIHHAFCGKEQENLTAWIFGDEKLESIFDKVSPEKKAETERLNKDRSAVKVFKMSK
jgi:hypothetical protein